MDRCPRYVCLHAHQHSASSSLPPLSRVTYFPGSPLIFFLSFLSGIPRFFSVFHFLFNGFFLSGGQHAGPRYAHTGFFPRSFCSRLFELSANFFSLCTNFRFRSLIGSLLLVSRSSRSNFSLRSSHPFSLSSLTIWEY